MAIEPDFKDNQFIDRIREGELFDKVSSGVQQLKNKLTYEVKNSWIINSQYFSTGYTQKWI